MIALVLWIVLSLVVLGGLAYYVAVLSDLSLVALLLLSYGFIAQLFPLLCAAFFWPRTTRPGALAGLAAGCWPRETADVAVEAHGRARHFHVGGARLGAVTETDGPVPDLLLRDLRATRITAVALGAEEVPVLTLARAGAGLSLTLEFLPDRLAPGAAVAFLSDFAARIEDPLRHLL